MSNIGINSFSLSVLFQIQIAFLYNSLSFLEREKFWIESAAHPFYHFLSMGRRWVLHRFANIEIARNTATILWRTGPLASCQNDFFRFTLFIFGRRDQLYCMLPTVTIIILKAYNISLFAQNLADAELSAIFAT